MATLALNIIAKDEVEQVRRIWNDYSQYFDEVCVAVDEKEDEFKAISSDPKLKIFKYEWCNDFAHKRNFVLSHTASDYVFRLDTDDVINNPQFIREAMKGYVANGFTLIMMMYYYGVDSSGCSNSRHWRETIFKNDGNLKWNKKIHENLIPVVERKRVPGRESKISITHDHKGDRAHYQKSFERNLKMLLDELNETKSKPDPRTIGYVARMYHSQKDFAKAIPYFEQFLATSGWDDDKYYAWIQLADCYTEIKQFDMALSCCNEAMLLNPTYPDAYFHLMSVYFEKKDFHKAIEWGRLGFNKKQAETMLGIDDTAYTWRPASQLAMCYLQIGRFADAVKLLKKAHDIAPREEAVSSALKFALELMSDNEAVRMYLQLMQYTKHDLRKFTALLDSIPKRIASDERLLTFKNSILPGRVWSDKSVVFFCGAAWEEWVDSSVVGGIGGSEEAVIYLSRELTKLGYEVTIYNSCGELAGNYRGVEYKSYFEFNPKDKFNILVCWRMNLPLNNIKARKKLIWLHDIPSKDMFLPEDSKNFDKVVVLSQFHKSLLTNVPDDKIYVSRNGVNVADFENIVEVRNPHRIIWASSYDRGLEPFLKQVWPKVRAEVPDAELHIYYGWNTYNEMVKQGRRDAGWKDMMVQLMNQPGVFEHGRIGHKKLAKEYFKAGIWGYPTIFEEISCIGAMKAQISGAVPVVNDYAALKETVKFGIKNDGDIKNPQTFDRYAADLIAILKDERKQESIRQDMMPRAKEMFAWSELAKEWQRDVLS